MVSQKNQQGNQLLPAMLLTPKQRCEKVRAPQTPPRPNDKHPLNFLLILRRNKTPATLASDRNLILLPYIRTRPSASPFYFPLACLRRRPKPPARVGGGRYDGGGVDGGAAAAGALLLRAAVLVLAGLARGRRGSGRVDTEGEQGVRGGACDDRQERAQQVGDGRADAAQQDGRRRGEPLQGPRERRRLHRGWARAVPALQQLVRVHPGLGRWGRRQRRFQAWLLPQTRGSGPGAEEGRSVDGGRAQVVLDGAEEVREGRLEEHLAQLRDEPDADAGGQPRAKVLHQAQLRRQGQAALQHPRHHHRQPARRRPRHVLPVAAVRAHHRLDPRRPGPVRRPRRREAPAPAAALRAPALHVAAATGGARCQPPVRQREGRAQELVRGRHGPRPRRFRPSADAMRAAVTAVLGAAKPAYGGENNGISSHPRTARGRTGQVSGVRAWLENSLVAELLLVSQNG